MTDAATRRSTLVIMVGYRGEGFSGMAEQPGRRTVLGELRRALEVVLRREVELDAAGRTDAGVHALGQYVSLPLRGPECQLSGRRMHASLVALTPDDLSVRALYRAEAGFSARFDATSRHYRYRIACGAARPVMAWDHAWWLRSQPRLDVAAMDRAARCLVGEHDFASFCKASSAQLIRHDGRSTCRNVQRVRVSQDNEAGEPLVTVEVDGNAFLHNMVRIVVGSLVEVGSGRRDVSWVRAALDACDRRAAGPTAPARGLCLEGVDYPAGALLPWD
ncbi:tRNA pseudouridine(38-40) synthase TruA [Olsenella massiliensis]|uniref:tRNA pseudouridine(38-40) synthase TruA n=1 Tax=Olsenella massiliensis TaxID=1622075 RepID=UPI000ADF1856|nr:tRNA pseudouridine(38-40) synthase TruA [Olsenella massiliensis]